MLTIVRRAAPAVVRADGLVNSDDIDLVDWQCTILGGMNTPVENRIISLLVKTGPAYPNEQPSVQFQTKVNFPFVDDKGKFLYDKAKLSWNKSSTIEQLLVQIKSLFAKVDFRKHTQPPDGSTY